MKINHCIVLIAILCFTSIPTSHGYRVNNLLRGMKNNSFAASFIKPATTTKNQPSQSFHSSKSTATSAIAYMTPIQAQSYMTDDLNLNTDSISSNNNHNNQISNTHVNKGKIAPSSFPWKKAALFSASILGIFLMKSYPVFALASPPSALTSFLNSVSVKESGFLQSFLLIFISEIGDKTFFIAGLLAAKYGRFISFTGSIGALAVMTIISTVIGQIFHAVPTSISKGIPFDDYIAVAAFAYFGIKTLLEASKLEPGDTSGIEEEKAEAEELVNEVTTKVYQPNSIGLILQTFSLVFAAEIGDRSFLSTIALSAALNPVSVALGAIAAHGAATGVAVIGGAFMSKYLSEKVIGYIGGSLFIIFAITTAFGLF